MEDTMEEPKITKKDKIILFCLIENGNNPTHATGIAEKSCQISRSWSSKRCPHLEKIGMLQHILIKPARKKNKTEYYFIAPTTAAVRVLFNAFNNRHESRELYAVMQSELFRDTIPTFLNDYCISADASTGVPVRQKEQYAFGICLKYYPSIADHVLNISPEKHRITLENARTNTRKNADRLQSIFGIDEQEDVELIAGISRYADHPNVIEKRRRDEAFVKSIGVVLDIVAHIIEEPMAYPYLEQCSILRNLNRVIGCLPALPMCETDAAELTDIEAHCAMKQCTRIIPAAVDYHREHGSGPVNLSKWIVHAALDM